MAKKKIKKPFFIFNPKSYLYGHDLEEMSKLAEILANKYPQVSVLLTAPFADISSVSQNVNSALISAQHIDGIKPGRGMGLILPESVKYAGASATFINHAEHPLTFDQIIQSIKRADELDLITIVCANSLEEAKAISALHPDIILCEPTELIGTGKISSEEYILNTNKVVKEISPQTLIMQGAGISTADDVFRVITLGADGTGCTSGITTSEDPRETFSEMVLACQRAIENKE
ncbi:hypothetical protein HMPREF9318_01901 [Streptococcus urinalis FB127-CNA-2]|uniref:Triose-phosphate isomerase n=1 Tax=Streptococcus urinalis 2285-97 TaxID=764291 RepID=G5KDD3_9STRE|nr:triose-phosphate isomerase [Streptococcus urinalis]EHJ55879.1 triose-phosphate isomerase [Streptococcus urinalis 2285-97]EKS17452.1 hypothetical protein HMPREF9318_01901 [Streptococcus urinalis FB127-CNA-2]VEF32726.1 triosephosphate isomerase [Streptococcus urinalis]